MSGLVIKLRQLPTSPGIACQLHVLAQCSGSQYTALENIVKVTTGCPFHVLVFSKRPNILKM